MKKFFVKDHSGRGYHFQADENDIVMRLENELEDDQVVELEGFVETSEVGDEWNDNWVIGITRIE